MSLSPDYLAYTVPCPLNAGKLAQVVAYVTLWRKLAGREAAWQWRHFFETRATDGFEVSARAGWSRPWVSEGESTVTFAQQVMAQVAGQLKGHIGNVQNTFVELVAKSSLSSNDKHRLFYLNRCKLWLAKCEVKSPIKGERHLSSDICKLGRVIFRQALARHRRPNFRYYHPQLDQRSVKLAPSQGKARKTNSKTNSLPQATTFPWWATVSTLTPGKTIALPVAIWPELQATIASTSQALAPAVAAHQSAKQARTAEKLKAEGKPESKAAPKSKRPPKDAKRCSLPNTIRLIVRPQNKDQPNSPLTLSLGLVVDHQVAREASRAQYTPIPGKVVAFDLGVSTFLATSDGDLLGRNWMQLLEHWDKQLVEIARGQQKRGLPVTTPRYRAITQAVDGFLKTEVFRLVNAWVARVRPEKIVREAVDFHLHPGLSKRMNRLLSRFGKRYLELALKRLEATHGIVVESREAAYSSQQCASCGYVDKHNRKNQREFACLFCGKRCHADVNAARVVRDRRSIAPSFSTSATRTRFLHAQVAAFSAAHPFVSRTASGGGQPLVRGRKDDPRKTNPYFSHVLRGGVNTEKTSPPSVYARIG